MIAHGKNSVNLSTASPTKVKNQASVTAKLIKERIRRDKMDELENLHRAECSGGRSERIEQEQNEQEQPAESDDDFLNSAFP